MWKQIWNAIWPTNSERRPVTLQRRPRESRASERRFEVADSSNANSARWARTDNRSINQTLQTQLRTIHERTAYEVRNNPIVEGTISTHARDVVGSNGPHVQIEATESARGSAWAREAEEFTNEWFDTIVSDGQQSIGDWLKSDIRSWWQTGDMLAQLVEPEWVRSGVRLRVHPLDSRGLVYTYMAPDVILGVRWDDYRRPIEYYITEVDDHFTFYRQQTNVIPADDVLHDYVRTEIGQRRGFPLLTQSLDVISELREHDGSVLKAAQRQAMMSVLMSTMDETAEAEDSPEEFSIKDGGITRAPVGWNLSPMMSTQPYDNHVDYRQERLRELGAPVGMPLMKLRHDSSKHNYSSARFDATSYQRANEAIQGWLWRRRVRPLIVMALGEAMLSGRLPVRSLRRMKLYGRWDQPPHADPVKEAMAATIRLNSRSSSPIHEAMISGKDFEQIAAEWRRANELLEANGMPPMLGPIGGQLTDLENWLSDESEDGDGNNANNITE